MHGYGLSLGTNLANFFLSNGTPAPIVKKLNAAIVETINTPDVEQRMNELGVRLVSAERRSPEYLAGLVRDEIEKAVEVDPHP
jgi:tripartite-type tricarboxylate transporter receptor subunit TctC